MSSWTLDDIDWDRFDRSKVDPDILAIVKAASLVEANGADYAAYLGRIFADDPEVRVLAERWGREEVQHGKVLARWAELADPGYDAAAASRRFALGFGIALTAGSSIRGSRAGEMVARCIVETGTSSYYSAIAEAVAEPVLRQICRQIAADEFRHYKMFYTILKRYLEIERTGPWTRLRIAFGRVFETEDDELAFAFHTANDRTSTYDRKAAFRAYAERAYSLYQPHHVERAMAMVLKAIGLAPKGYFGRWASVAAWWVIQAQAGFPARSRGAGRIRPERRDKDAA